MRASKWTTRLGAPSGTASPLPSSTRRSNLVLGLCLNGFVCEGAAPFPKKYWRTGHGLRQILFGVPGSLFVSCLFARMLTAQAQLIAISATNPPPENLLNAETLAGSSPVGNFRKTQKEATVWPPLFVFGAPSGTRTLGPLIKSQLLYQLS